MLERVNTCEARYGNRGLNMDHVPILMTLDLTLDRTPEHKSSNFREVDWEEFCLTLEKEIASFGVPKRLGTQMALNHECDRLTIALQNTIKRAVPITEICSKSR